MTPYTKWLCLCQWCGAYTISISWMALKRNNGIEEPMSSILSVDNDVILRGIPKLDVNNKLYYDGDIYSSDGKVQEYVDIEH